MQAKISTSYTFTAMLMQFPTVGYTATSCLTITQHEWPCFKENNSKMFKDPFSWNHGRSRAWKNDS